VSYEYGKRAIVDKYTYVKQWLMSDEGKTEIKSKLLESGGITYASTPEFM